MHLSQRSFPDLCELYLQQIYHNLQMNKASIHSKTDNITESNGEFAYASVNKLLQLAMLNEQDVLIDLGSGSGKVVVQAFLTTVIKEARGIEIRADLHTQATTIANQVAKDLPAFYQPNRILRFLQGSFFELPLHDATIIIINATCFDPSMMQYLSKIVTNLSNLRAVFTTRPLNNINHLFFKKAIRVECSWDSALCYWYEALI